IWKQRGMGSLPPQTVATQATGVETTEEAVLTLRTVERTIREEHFPHHPPPPYARLNHGSYGASPTSVINSQNEFRARWFHQPDEYLHRGEGLAPSDDPSPLPGNMEADLRRSVQTVASLVNADPSEICLVDNATTGAVIVAQDVLFGFVTGRFRRGDVVLMADTGYNAVKKLLERYVVGAGGELVFVDMPFPVHSLEQILDAYRKTVEAVRKRDPPVRICFAAVDHISSLPMVVLPLKELVEVLHGYEIPVFVDGAHGIGNVRLDMAEIGADFYVSNLHKWLLCPPPVAFFHAKKEHSPRLHHPVTSHNLNRGLFLESAWVGTRDYSAQLCVPSAVEFIHTVLGGVDMMIDSNTKAALEMGRMLAGAWGTGLGAPPEMQCSMVMVGLPDAFGVNSFEDSLRLRTRLRDEWQVEVPLYYLPEEKRKRAREVAAGLTESTEVWVGRSYARVSHHVYNDRQNYERLRDAVLALAKEASEH
ncbi:cysteine desulfurase, partial [Klebsormidium nitens]